MADVDLDTLCKEGRQYFRQGKYAQAIQLFDKAIRLDPDQPEVHDAIGTAYFVLKNYDKAIEHFTRVTQLKPMDPKPLINLGAVFNRKEEFQKATDVLKKAISRDGKAVEAYYNMGIAYRGMNQLAMSISSYKEALKINPRMLDAIQNLGNCYLEQGNHKAATEQYKKALEINPDFERAQRGLARAEEAKKKTEASFSPFGRLVDESTLKQSKSAGRFRRLTSEERINDRQVLRRMSIELKDAAEALLDHARDELDNAVIQLNRGVQSSVKETSKLLFSSKDNFQEVIQEFAELRANLKHILKELSAHESGMKE